MRKIAFAIGLGLALPTAAFAQSGIGTLSHADAGVTRLRLGAPAAATAGTTVLDGDHIQTTNGRAEIALPDGTLLHLDHHARVIVRAGDRSEMLDGRMSVRTGGTKPYLVDVATTKLSIQTGSVVEIASRATLRDMDLRVINGSVQVDTPNGSARVPDYKRCYVAGPASSPAVTNVVPTLAGDFERWALTRTVLATSTPLKGTENGGGVAYAPWIGSYFAYASPIYYPAYVTYYTYPYYPYYYPSYSSYYSYYTPSYYTPSSSYYRGYSGYYNGYYGYGSSYRESYTFTRPEPAATPRFGPPAAAPVSTAPGAIRGAAIPKP
jgi:hypothetical protein